MGENSEERSWIPMTLSIAALILVVIGLFVGYKWFTNFGNAGAQQSVAA